MAIAHLCYKNEVFSLKIIETLLKAISYCSSDQVHRLLTIVEKLTLLKDELQHMRIKAMFGDAQT